MILFSKNNLRGNTGNAKRGFTLTELAIVLGVIGLILSAIWVAAAKVTANNKVQRAAAQIQQIINNHRKLYAAHGIDLPGCWLVSDDVTCVGANNGLFPADMIPPGNSCVTQTSGYPKTPFGGNASAYIQTCHDNNAFLVGYNYLSQSECNSLANAIYNGDMVYQSISPDNGVTFQTQWLPPFQVSTPWTPAQIATYCGPGNLNTVLIGVSVN